MLKNHSIVWQIIISLALIQGMMWVLVFKNAQLPPEVPLFYYKPWGASQLGDPLRLWLLPCLSALTLAINVPVALYFYPRQRRLAQLLVLSTLLISALSAWALFLLLGRIGLL